MMTFNHIALYPTYANFCIKMLYWQRNISYMADYQLDIYLSDKRETYNL